MGPIAALAPVLIAALLGAPRARAEDAGTESGRLEPMAPERSARVSWFSLGALAGSTRPDQALANYQWDTRPRTAWGGQALAGRGRYAAGLRLWRTHTTQRFDFPDGPTTSSVRATSLELVGRYRLAAAWGAGISATAGVGRLHLGYDPDRVTVQPPGSPPNTVELEPIDEWIGGGGLAVVRPLASKWTVGLEVDTQVFGLETAHRNGGAIEYGRESFGAWSARIELARCYRPR